MKWLIKKALSFVKEIYYVLSWLILKFASHNKTNMISLNSKKVLVFGNGPSAKEIDYNAFRADGYDFLCVNYFALDEVRFLSVKPKYYCCIDPVLYNNELDTYYSENTKRLFNVLNIVDWEMHFICLPGQSINFTNNNISIERISSIEYLGNLQWLKMKLYNNNLATVGYQNVVVAALFYLITGSIHTIALIGVENDWHRELYVNKRNEVIRKTTHFYGEQTINVTEVGEIKKGELYKYFYWYYKTLYQYNLIAKYAKCKGVEVYNYCETSYIDVFEKKNRGIM